MASLALSTLGEKESIVVPLANMVPFDPLLS